MGYKTLFKEENDQVRERYSLALERIRQVADEDTVKAPFKDFFKKNSRFYHDD